MLPTFREDRTARPCAPYESNTVGRDGGAPQIKRSEISDRGKARDGPIGDLAATQHERSQLQAAALSLCNDRVNTGISDARIGEMEVGKLFAACHPAPCRVTNIASPQDKSLEFREKPEQLDVVIG